MRIIGLNYGLHDQSIAIIENNEIILSHEMERETRIKKNYIFHKAVNHEIFFSESNRVLYERFLKETKPDDVIAIAGFADTSNSLDTKIHTMINYKKIDLGDTIDSWRNFNNYIIKDKVYHITHHFAHVAYAYFTNPFDEFDVLSYDSTGRWYSAIFLNSEDNVIVDLSYELNLGSLWLFSSWHLRGMEHVDDAGILMGAAAYGEVNLEVYDFLKTFIKKRVIDPMRPGWGSIQGKSQEEKMGVFSDFFTDANKLNKGNDRYKFYFDYCHTLQKVSEETVMELMKPLQKSKNLCTVGGCALNGYINMKLHDLYDEVYTPPACHDAGLSLGVALHANWKLNKNKKIKNKNIAYLGKEYSVTEELVKQLCMNTNN